MAIKLLGSNGGVTDAAVINMRASGVVHPNGVVALLHTAGQGVSPVGSAPRTTIIFGVSLDYAQGASDVEVKVIPFQKDQLWAADAYNTVATSQIGLRHAIRQSGTDAAGRFIENTGSDISQELGGVFLCLAVDASTGSGKVIGRFIQDDVTDLLAGL